MEPIPIWRKPLTDTHINHRLSFPTNQLHLLPPFEEGANEVEFGVRVRHGDELRPHVLRCVDRRGDYRKPVIEAGWRDIVREKELREGDLLIFSVDNDGEYVLEFQRKIMRLMGRDIWGPV